MTKYFKIIFSTIFVLTMMLAVNAKTVNITDFGAEPNDGIDDSYAVESAIVDLVENGGGTVVFPSGTTDLNSEIRFATMDNSSFRLTGDKGSVVRLNGNESNVYFDIRTATQFDIDNLIFTGKPDVNFDALKIFSFKNVKQVNIRNSNFFGVGAYNSLVFFEDSAVTIENTVFIGSAGLQAVINSSSSKGLSVSNCVFENIGEIRGETARKPFKFSQQSWIKVTNTLAAFNSMATGTVRVVDTLFDSGALNAMYMENQGIATFSGVTIKMSPMKTGFGVQAKNVGHFDVKNTSFATTGKARVAFTLVANTFMFVDGLMLYNSALIGEMDNSSQRVVQRCVGCAP
jgi:hypothetical protein